MGKSIRVKLRVPSDDALDALLKMAPISAIEKGVGKNNEPVKRFSFSLAEKLPTSPSIGAGHLFQTVRGLDLETGTDLLHTTGRKAVKTFSDFEELGHHVNNMVLKAKTETPTGCSLSDYEEAQYRVANTALKLTRLKKDS